MDHVSTDAVVRDAPLASSEVADTTQDVSQLPQHRQEGLAAKEYADADGVTLHDELHALRHDGGHLYQASNLHTSTSQIAQAPPIEHPAQHVGDILRAHLENRAFRDVSEDGYILEPESSYQTLLGSDAQLQEMQRVRRSQYRLEVLREDAEGMRLKVREARTALRRDRAALRDLEATTMDRLQTAVNERENETILRGIAELAKLKDSRDQLNAHEDEYNSLEDHLLSGEWEMRQAEANVYDTDPYNHASSVYQDEIMADTSSQAMPVSPDLAVNKTVPRLGAIANEVPAAHSRPFSATSQLYEVRRRALEIQTNLKDLRKERELLLKEERSRARVHRSLDSQSRRILDEFLERERDLLNELQVLEDDETQLQPIVEDQNETFFQSENFVGHGGEVDIRDVGDLASELEDFNMAITNEQLEVMNELFDVPTMASESLTLGFLFYSPDEALSKTDSVNEWLLQVLRCSKGQQYRFVSRVKLQDLFHDKPFPQARQLIVSCWFHDGTNPDFGGLRSDDTLSKVPSRQTVYESMSIVTPLQSNSTKSIQELRCSSDGSDGLSGSRGKADRSVSPRTAPSVEQHMRDGSTSSSGNALTHGSKHELGLAIPVLAARSRRHNSSQTEPITLAAAEVNRMTDFHLRLPGRGRTRSIPPLSSGYHFTTRSLP